MTLQEMFLENLESEMSKKKITYYQISKNTNIPHSTFSSWKNKNANPTIDKLASVCQYLEISADRLLGLPGREPPDFTDEEIFLIECFRNADEIGKEMIRRTCTTEGNVNTVKSSNSNQNLKDNVYAKNRQAQ